MTAKLDIDSLFIKQQLVPVVVQDADSNEVLMLAYCNKESLRQTLSTGYAHYYSRSRERLWKKGESSGNVQKIVSVTADCDLDTFLYRVKQTGPACHTGSKTCFFNAVSEEE